LRDPKVPTPAGWRQVATRVASVLPAPSRFLVVCPPRTGSELLVELLDSHPLVRCEGELFKAPRPAPLRYAAGRSAIARRRGAAAWGCKLLDQQLLWQSASFGSPEELLRRATEQGFVLVHLTRRDLLAQAASVLHSTSQGFHFREGDGVTFEPFHADVALFIATLHLLDDHAGQIEAAFGDLERVRLVYEDDLLTPERQAAGAARVFAAVGVAPAPVRSTLRPAAPLAAADRITNWADVAAAVRLTRFAGHLPAPPGP
jgi:LPS sulfotransferase NodH